VKAKLKAKKTVSWPAGSDEDGDSDELIEEILDAGERGDEQPIVMQGWMEKKGGYKRRNWKRFVGPFSTLSLKETNTQFLRRRWFVLRGSSLTYYTGKTSDVVIGGAKTGARKKGIITLHSLRVHVFEHHTRQFVFTLTHPTDKARVYYMSCDSRAEQIQWMDLLQASSWVDFFR
jgi:hypothetical protein